VDIGDAHLSFGNVLVFAVAIFLLAGVYSLVRQGLRIAALIVLVLAVLAATAGVMWL
jgi:hypothetical protein